MANQRIVPQVEYETLEEFVEGSDNFYLFFGSGFCSEGAYRTRNAFKRFQEAYPELERELALQVNSNSPPELPWQKLFEAYKLMSQLVHEDDPHVMIDGKPDKNYLTK
jgi:hypothetical protein